MATATTARTAPTETRTAPSPGETALAAQGTTAVRNWGFRDDVVALAKHINGNLTEAEMRVFLYEAWRLQLDPASGKQIYAVVYNKDDPNKRKMSIQIAIDGLRVIAARTGLYDGSAQVEDGPEVDSDGVKHPDFCVATVWRKGAEHPFVAKVRWNERRKKERYGPRSGQLTEFWADQPYGQLEKCAEAAALRKAFPMELRGAGVMEDVDDDDADDERRAETPVTEARVVETPAAPPPAPPAAPAGNDPKWIVSSVRDLMDDPAVRENLDVRRKADDLLNTRLDALGLHTLWDAKPEHIPALTALRDDLRLLVKA
ncbi:MAG TPA: phage recombination protein Bet [Thermoplasmata archaeon]|nr:phage recombination protein Bet [Thermoplasmata archaeon]